MDESLLMAPRQASGELPVVPLMRLASGSDLLEAGVAFGYPFSGVAPELGAFEDGLIELGTAGLELPVVSVPVVGKAGAVWRFSGTAGIRPDGAAPEGDQVGFLDNGGAMTQSCAGFVPGADYHVHLEANAPSGSGTRGVVGGGRGGGDCAGGERVWGGGPGLHGRGGGAGGRLGGGDWIGRGAGG